MLNFEPYAIHTEDDEYHGSDKEFFNSYEEAYAARMNYANWYRNKGDIWIRHLEKNGCSLIEEWHIHSDGYIIKHYDFSKKEKQKPIK